MGQGGGQGGVDGGGHQRAVWGQQGVHWFHLLGSLQNLTIGLIWLGVEGVGQGGGQGGGRWGGAVWEQQGVHGSLKNLTIGLIWLVTRGAGVGGVGQGGGQGGVDGGGTREQCGSNKAFTASIFWAP